MSAIQTDESEDRFYVQFDSAEVRLMSLEELDDAFQRGLIHENTYVLREGDSEWQTLSDVAGLDEEPEAQIAADAPPSSPNAIYHAPAWPPAPTRSSPVAAASIVAPSLTTTAPPRSVIPVVQDVRPDLADFDDLDSPFKPKRRWGLFAAVAAVAMAGGAFAVTQLKAPSAAAISAVAAAPAALTTTRPSITTASEMEKPEPAPKTQPTTAAPSESDVKASSDTASKKDSADKDERFSEDMKAALLSADKQKVSKRKARSTGARARHSARKSKSRGKKGSVAAGFKNGGSAHDPLNGKL